MLDPHLARKITMRALPSVTLHRHALVAQLQEALAVHTLGEVSRYRVILCCAPAGYGKTTLLTDFARSTSLPCCWYFLDQTDTDPVVFLRTLLASVRQVFSHFGQGLDSLFEQVLSHPTIEEKKRYYSALDAFCTALTNETPQPFVLIVSNYEEISEYEAITDLVNYLLTKLPSHATLLIESRVIPDLDFTPLVICDELCGLHQDHLRFSAQEIVELSKLQGNAVLTEAEAEALVESFHGWIAGILLGTRVGQARIRLLTHQVMRPSMFHNTAMEEQQQQMLFAYIVDDVLKQDTTIAAFLQSIAILQQIEPSLCNALLDLSDSEERLAWLERQGLFLSVQETASGLVYTFHPVIRHVLSEHLHKIDPERFRTLHHRAIDLWRASQSAEQAMYHALTIGAFDLAVAIIAESAEALLQQGQHETVSRWLHAIPAEIQEHHPALLLLQATFALNQGRHTLAFSLLSSVTELLPTCPIPEPDLFQAKLDLLRSKALFQAGVYRQAQEICEGLLSSVSKPALPLRAEATMRIGICASLQGNFSLGITSLQESLHLWRHQPPLVQASEIHQALANVYYLTGNFPLAHHHLAQVLAVCDQLSDETAKGGVLILQGLLAQRQGLAAEAEAAFLQALSLGRTLPQTQRNEAYALVNLASLAVERGQYTQALAYATQGLVLAQTCGNRSLVNDALVSQAISYLFLDDPTSALFTTEQMEVHVSGEQTVGYEQVWHDLTVGLIHLLQRQYAEAVSILETIDAAMSTTDLKRERFQAKLRLAAGYVAQEQIVQALALLQAMSDLLTTFPTYTHLVCVELQWFPSLLQVVQTHPQLSSLRASLELAEPLQLRELQRPALSLLPTSLARLTIMAFDEPTVLLDGQLIKNWRMARAMELFFFLLDVEQPVSKETLLTALWPEYDDKTTQTFHNTIYQIRKLLGNTSVVCHPNGYSLDLSSCYGDQIFYDVRAFQHSWREAEQALASEEPARAKESLLNMVQLYRGDYGRAFYNEWSFFRRDELRLLYFEARRQLAQIAWCEEAWQECAEHWRQIMRLDSCLEEAHYGLMRCYLKQGKRGAALRQYHTCAKILQEELDVHPGQAMQHLYQRITAKNTAE